MPEQNVNDEIIALAIRAEKRQRARQWRVAIVVGSLVLLGLFALALWGNWTLRNLREDQKQELIEARIQQELIAEETDKILLQVQRQLVPRRDFRELERQMEAINRRLKRQEKVLREVAESVARIERSLPRRASSGGR